MTERSIILHLTTQLSETKFRKKMKIKSRIQSLKSDKLVLKIFDQIDKQSLKPKLTIPNTENLMLNLNKILVSIE